MVCCLLCGWSRIVEIEREAEDINFMVRRVRDERVPEAGVADRERTCLADMAHVFVSDGHPRALSQHRVKGNGLEDLLVILRDLDTSQSKPRVVEIL